MTSKPPRLLWRPSREIGVVIALTFVGAVIRLWAPGRLGLIHFDEGIYALAGLWCFSPLGLAGIDPTVISYAPPGFPVLVGLSYLVFGVNDLAAILVSVCSGTLTIPLAAWLARRTFGPGAGGAAAVFAALSGPHISFSRMALTDTSFLLVWLIAVGMGQRFLERPNPARAIALGLAVGLSQLFKYNGWISGVIVALSAAAWPAFHPVDRRITAIAPTWGWGLFAAIVAAIVYWPWFAFVDSHGGYSALLAHQRSYLGGLSSWPNHWSLQLAQTEFLSGGTLWLAGTGALAALGMSFSQGDLARGTRLLPRIVAATSGLMALCLIPGFSWWVAPIGISMARLGQGGSWSKSACVLCLGWVFLSVLTPFYHPYARLWLPIDAFGWLLIGGVFVGIRSQVEIAGRGKPWTWNRSSDPLPWFVLCGVVAAISISAFQTKKQHMALLQPSDSIRRASRTILDELPQNMNDLRVYARPPVPFYIALAGGVQARRQPDLAHLLAPESGGSWALLDLAMIRQENMTKKDMARLLDHWVLVREIPTTLNPPTLLDIDPSAARGAMIDPSAPIRLLRPRRTENIR